MCLQREVAVRPKRPGHGKAGTPTQVAANHFRVKIRVESAAHYDVDIQPVRKSEEPPVRGKGRPEKPLPPELLRSAIRTLAKQEKWKPGDMVYDGRKNIFSSRKFLGQNQEFQVGVRQQHAVHTS